MGEARPRHAVRPLGNGARPRRPGPPGPRRRVLSRHRALKFFVYGTLKRGQRNHGLCEAAAAIEGATVRGRLYDLPLGFPALVVPEADVRAVGTADYGADAGLSGRPLAEPREDLAGWDVVHGELVTFEDAESRTPALDALEGFRPGWEGLYTRVLVPVTLREGGRSVTAWAYSIREGFGVHLPEGSWPPG